MKRSLVLSRIVHRSSARTPIALLIVFSMWLCPAAVLQADPVVRKTGKLTVPHDIQMMVFCSDPLIGQVIRQDLQVAKRAADSNSKSPQTLTITVTQQPLKPGVSLEQIAPGAPQVAELIKSAGVTPPPIGDTGNQSDRGAVARQQALEHLHPMDSPMQQLLNEFQGHGDLGPPIPCSQEANPQPGCAEPTPKPQPGSAGYTGDVQDYVQSSHPENPFFHHDDKEYDSVIVARVTLSGAPDDLTVVAVAHAGDDINDVRKLVAEEIADVVLQ